MYDKVHKFSWLDGMLAAGLALITVGIGLNLKTRFDDAEVKFTKGTVTPTVVQVDIKVKFDIAGQVLKPGVYSLNKGGRVVEALAMAGGLAVNADRDWVEKNINMAKMVVDGEKIYIPKKNDQETSSKKQILGSQIININFAGINELDGLEGVGPSIAQRIIDYRDKNGGFKDVNELKLVSGIGEKMYEKIKDKVGI